MGMVTVAGGGIRTGGISAVFFLWGIWTPLRSFKDILTTSFSDTDQPDFEGPILHKIYFIT
jgi:hypothetical protein